MNLLASSTLGRAFFAIAIFCMAIAIVIIGKPLLAPLALSFIIAFVLTPIVRRLESFGIGRIASVLSIVLLLAIVSLFLGAQLLSQLNALVTELPQHRQEIEEKLSNFRTGPNTPISQVIEVAKEFLGEFGSSGTGSDLADVQRVAIVEKNSALPWVSSASNLVGGTFEPVAVVLVVVVLVVYMLISREDLRNRFLALIGNRHLTSATTIVNESSSRLGNYLLGLVAVNFAFALCFGFALYFLHVPYAAVCGTVTFVFRFVPLLGSFVSMLLPLSVSLLFMPGWSVPVSVVVIYLSLEGVTGNVLEPWLFGKSVGMNPFALLIAIMFWTWAWGALGLMMATPMSLMLATLGRHVPFLRSLDFLLSDSRPLPAHLVYFQRLLANDVSEAEALLKSIISKRGLPFVVDKVAIRSMNHSERELKGKVISNELHRLVGQRNDALLWKIMASMQTVPHVEKVVASGGEATDSALLKNQKAFGISLSGERTNATLRAVELTCPTIE
jgi:predicted PurR-regulated permease PerM